MGSEKKQQTRAEEIADGVKRVKSGIAGNLDEAVSKLSGEERALVQALIHTVKTSKEAGAALDGTIAEFVSVIIDETRSSFENGVETVLDSMMLSLKHASPQDLPGATRFCVAFREAMKETIAEGRAEWLGS